MVYLTVILRTRVVYEMIAIYDESEWNNCFIIYTALDEKQHNYELKVDYLKLILHSRHAFL